jgi:hypothetical protein
LCFLSSPSEELNGLNVTFCPYYGTFESLLAYFSACDFNTVFFWDDVISWAFNNELYFMTISYSLNQYLIRVQENQHLVSVDSGYWSSVSKIQKFKPNFHVHLKKKRGFLI